MVKKKQKKKTKEKITKKMTFSKVLEKYPETAQVFFEHGMACVGCPMAMQETIEQGALAHGLDVKKLIEDLNKKVTKK
jgi:hybrid cluster-associated redox disulfide protein